MEEPESLLVRSRCQADDEGVEVVENLAPKPIDRAVALVHDHEVEKLDRQSRVIHDWGGVRSR